MAALAGGSRTLAGAAACTACINILALTGPGYMLLLYGRVVPSGDRRALIAATLAALMLYALGAAAELARQKLVSRSALRLGRGLRAVTARHPGAASLRDLNAIGNFFSGPAPAAVCDLPFIPLYVAVLLWLHPLLGALALAGAAAIGACTVLAGARSREARSTHTQLLAAGMLRALRPALPSMMLGLGAYLVMEGACHSGSVLAAAIVLPRILAPIEAILAHWGSLMAALSAARRLGLLTGAADATASRDATSSSGRTSHPGLRIVLRRSSDYARSATRGGATSPSSGFRPTAQ